MSKPTARQTDLVAAVRAHALANYDGGWDVIVEAYEDSEIAELIGKARTEKGAIKKVAAVVDVRREAAENAGWSEAQRELEIGYADMQAEQTERRPALEPDGSIVKCSYSWDGELLSATRTWPGKVGHAEIAVNFDGDGTAETYVPGWRGWTLQSANYCDHDAPEGELCWSHDCRRPNCCPF